MSVGSANMALGSETVSALQTDGGQSSMQVLAMEEQVLDALAFGLTVPTAKTFLRRYIKAAIFEVPGTDGRFEQLAAYLTELMLVEYAALQFLPSEVCYTL